MFYIIVGVLPCVLSDDHYSAFTDSRPKLMLEGKEMEVNVNSVAFQSFLLFHFFSLLLQSRNKCKESWNIRLKEKYTDFTLNLKFTV